MLGDSVMECSCQIDGDGDVSYLHYESRTVKARKEHICSECRAKIKVGERYEYVKGYSADGIEIWKTCLPCVGVADLLYCRRIHGMLGEDFYEHFEFDYLEVPRDE